LAAATPRAGPAALADHPEGEVGLANPLLADLLNESAKADRGRQGLCRLAVRDGKFAVLFPRLEQGTGRCRIAPRGVGVWPNSPLYGRRAVAEPSLLDVVLQHKDFWFGSRDEVEDPLDKALRDAGLGEVSGGGMSNRDRTVRHPR
jgi:hypothetical protein